MDEDDDDLVLLRMILVYPHPKVVHRRLGHPISGRIAEPAQRLRTERGRGDDEFLLLLGRLEQ